MRNPFLLIATGTQGIGKSFTTTVQAIHQCYISKYKRSALFFDTNNEYQTIDIHGKTHTIPAITINDIVSFSNAKIPEVRRIVPFHPNGMPMSPEETEQLLVKVINLLRNSTLIIEDLSRIYGDVLPHSLTSLLCNVRHRNCDVISHLQSVGRILPKVYQNCRIIRFHYQLDSIESSREKLKDEYEIFKIAEALVNKEFAGGNRHFFVYVYREDKKIKGQFSPRMFSEAILEFLSETPRAINSLLSKRDNNGKKIHTYQSALNQKTVELFKKYYGN